MLELEWDPAKARRNLRDHRVAFGEAATVFRDPLGITAADPAHSDEELRWITVGTSRAGRLLLVAHTDRGGRVRIISARELTRTERAAYEDEIATRQRR